MSPKPQPWYAKFNQPPRSPKDGRNRRPSAPTHRDPPDRTNSGVDPGSQDTTTSWAILPGGITFIYPISLPTPPTIPYAGVRAGEIIGHRMWLIREDNYLGSLAHDFIWQPGATIEGKVHEVVDPDPFMLFRPIMGGVYSYFDAHQLTPEVLIRCGYGLPFNARSGFIVYGLALGAIKCWGEVIEHQKGWRAQFAKLQSINCVIGEVDLNQLRSKYYV